MRVKIIKNLNKHDKYLVEKLIGCKFDVLKENDDKSVIIDVLDGGLRLEQGEYEVV